MRPKVAAISFKIIIILFYVELEIMPARFLECLLVGTSTLL